VGAFTMGAGAAWLLPPYVITMSRRASVPLYCILYSRHHGGGVFGARKGLWCSSSMTAQVFSRGCAAESMHKRCRPVVWTFGA
jgi:hypothetical protein